jgi:putative aldouronate transport system permease protein
MVSFTQEAMIIKNGYSLFPEQLSIQAYKIIFSNDSTVLISLAVTSFVTFVGSVAAVVITGMAGYSLANKNVEYRGAISIFFYVTMVFHAGIVPWYLICTKLGIKDNLFALIIPGIFSPFNLFLVKNFMAKLPDPLRESASIDGASDITIAFRIYFPLSKPILATIALFYGLSYWLNWFNCIMLVENQNLYTLQYLLLRLKSEISTLKKLQEMGVNTGQLPPSEGLKMATAIITIGPIVLLYPYLQKYFVKGLVIGSVKG